MDQIRGIPVFLTEKSIACSSESKSPSDAGDLLFPATHTHWLNETAIGVAELVAGVSIDNENINYSNNRKRNKRRRLFKSDRNINISISKIDDADNPSSPSSSPHGHDDSFNNKNYDEKNDDEVRASHKRKTDNLKNKNNNDQGSSSSPDERKDDSTSEDKTSSFSSSSSTTSSSPNTNGERNEKNAVKKKKKRRGFWGRLMTSDPNEMRLVKMVLWFPVGVGISLLLYYLVIEKMRAQPLTKAVIGGGLGVILSLTFALSVQMRCIMYLVIPTFVGKAGRSYIAAFALVYLINGPITNIIDNSKEVVRALTCTSSLMANHTREKWRLRLAPIEDALSDLQGDSFQLNRAAHRVQKAFKPLRDEVEENKEETVEMEERIDKVESDQHTGEKTVRKVEKSHAGDTFEKDPGKKVEKEWEKKLDLRCEDTFAKGVERCREKMGDLEDRCMDKLSVLGYLFCWPLKITLFCQIVKLLPGAFGMNCQSKDLMDPGFGRTFVDARSVVDDMDEGMKVQMQYQMVGEAQMDYRPVEEMRQATIHEVNRKATVVNFFFSIISHILTFTFLLIFHGAYSYNKRYLTDISFDNIYLTSYYRHIDARRRAQGKKTLLPLKKSERKDYIDPAKMVLTKGEKGKLTKGAAKLILRVIVCAVICYMDSLLYQVLDIISRNSRMEYHQTGEHVINIKVYGNGFMSALVQSFLQRFNSKRTLDRVTTNQECLPRPSQTDDVIVAFIFGTYCVVWLFMYFEAYGLRMRRVIAAFFYRKREKKRVLFLYNDMFRKRLGFLRHMRKKVRKQLRKREFKKKVGLIVALQNQFPRLCGCLSVCKPKKDSCIICDEPEGEGFYRCPTPGCGVGYCKDCWVDIKRKCYACGAESDDDDDADYDDGDDSPDSGDETTDSEAY